MGQLIDVFGFIAVLLRGLNLALASLIVGGLVFATFVVPEALAKFPAGFEQAMVLSRWWIAIASALLAAVQVLWLATNTAILIDTTGLSFAQIVGANYFLSGLAIFAVAMVMAAYASRARRIHPLANSAGVLLIAADVTTSHALARVDHVPLVLAATAIHQAATGAWVGALPFWLFTVRDLGDSEAAQSLGLRFSRLATAGFLALVSAGIVLSLCYVASPDALYGTNYGLMVAAKVVLTAMVIVLAAFNHRLVRAPANERATMLAHLRVLGEAEAGIAFTIVLAAASLTSQPPAADLATDRVTLPVIAARMAPRLPRLETPPLNTLSPSSRAAWKRQHANTNQAESYVPGTAPWRPPSPGDIAWSEYNHHWAGVVVLLAGVLAVLSRSTVRWARHWPLAFLGLAMFLLLRADPESWPLGPDGFWESFASADVTQHRLFVVLIVLFAFFEWGVQVGRLRSPKAALVFPGVCALGGALLLTHTHALSNVQEELLAEMSHLPLAILAIGAGWARWLELRLPSRNRVVPSRVWPVCFVLIGVVLLFYREA